MKTLKLTFSLPLLFAVTAFAKNITVSPGDSLARARDMARSGDRIILHGGTYRLDEPLVLGPQNSGVTWMAYPNETPVISGGIPVTGWIADTDGRFKAKVNLDNFRQLWVNGRRAPRARGPVPAGLQPWGKIEASAKNGTIPSGLTGTPGYFPGTLENIAPAGFTTTDTKLADWKNPGDMEFGFYTTWQHMVCKVEKITQTPDGAIIEMSQPGFFLSHNNGMSPRPAYMENALELLHEPGQWYFDRPSHTLYYLPLPGEDMAKAEVIAPKLEKLLEVKGTLDRPVHDIRFEGLTFAHATWLRPSTALGHPDGQANFLYWSDNSFFRPDDHKWSPVNGEFVKSPANVEVDAGHDIQFHECTFTALGGAGLDLQDGAQSNTVSGCRFFDISGNGVQIGDVTAEDHHPGDPRRIVKDNQVINNVITRIGREYTDSVGVFYGYTEGTVVSHNEIFDIPYTGVSGGWGWGMADAGGGAYASPIIYNTASTCKDNRIEYNHIHDLMLVHEDGGGIYTLGRQPGTIIRGNYIHDSGHFPGGVYLDEGSAGIEVTGNVINGVPGAMHLNNRAQHRDASCPVHDNFFSAPPVIVPGVNGHDALKAGSYVNMQDGTQPAQFSLTAWVRLDNYPGGNDSRRWIVCQAPNESVDRNISFIVVGKFLGGYLNIGGGQQNCFTVSGTGDELPLNRWTPVAMTYDGETLRVYRDGKETGEQKIGKARVPATVPWTIGARSDQFRTFDCGEIADVRLYDHGLTPEELRGKDLSGPKGLIQAWEFEKLPGQEGGKIIAEAGLESSYRHLLSPPTIPQ